MALLASALKSLNRRAILTADAAYTYRDLLRGALNVAQRLEEKSLRGDGKWGPRVGLYLEPSAEYIAATWGTWLANGIVVPLCLSHTAPEIEHVVCDAEIPIVALPIALSQATRAMCQVLTHGDQPLKLPSLPQTQFTALGDVFRDDRRLEVPRLPRDGDGALLLYTSGTTGKPKGALHTHRSLSAQVAGLTEAWEWSADDVLLHALPLHHIHGIVVALYAALSNGAAVELLPKFSPSRVWSVIKGGGVSMFMGVPTMYSHLLAFFAAQSVEEQALLREAATKLRLYVSGSAACPLSVIRDWNAISGHTLLERYGMTEIGVALSNPLHVHDYQQGYVGSPLPGVSVKVDRVSGELSVKGETLLTEYWRNAAATTTAFDVDGYFRTGDIVKRSGEPPYFKILGRQSVDIIKSGGYKLSALEIENAVLEHPEVKECSVVGVPDVTYGEIVTAVVALKNSTLTDDALVAFCRRRLASYKLPRRFVRFEAIPRNAMGKVNKKELLALIQTSSDSATTTVHTKSAHECPSGT